LEKISNSNEPNLIDTGPAFEISGVLNFEISSKFGLFPHRLTLNTGSGNSSQDRGGRSPGSPTSPELEARIRALAEEWEEVPKVKAGKKEWGRLKVEIVFT
jgi:hypothetical protein